jgi:hypothetical protein
MPCEKAFEMSLFFSLFASSWDVVDTFLFAAFSNFPCCRRHDEFFCFFLSFLRRTRSKKSLQGYFKSCFFAMQRRKLKKIDEQKAHKKKQMEKLS